MPIKRCECGAITGFRHHCVSLSGNNKITDANYKGPSGRNPVDRKTKRRIDQAIRLAGGVPARHA